MNVISEVPTIPNASHKACWNLVSSTGFFFVLLSSIPGPQIEYHDFRTRGNDL